MEIRKIFANNLKLYRQKKNLSQMMLAEKSQITTNFINDIENCKKWISPETLAKLSNALDIQPYCLFTSININYSEAESKKVQEFSSEVLNSFIQTIKDILKRY